MFGFCLKKFFILSWENFFFLGIFNFVNMIFLTLLFSAPLYLKDITSYYGTMGFMLIISLIFFAILGVEQRYAYDIAHYKEVKLSNFFPYLKQFLLKSILFNSFVVLFNYIFVFEIYFYSVYNPKTFVLSFFILWLMIISNLASIYLFSLSYQQKRGFFSTIKTSFSMFFDNPIFTLSLFLFSIVILAMSVCLIFLFPGIMGVMLFYQSSTKMRLYKYDYFEDYPDSKKVDWDKMLFHDKKKDEGKTFRNMLLPWKY